MQQEYDLVIIGSGPIGLACAIEAQNNNLNYLIIEKGTLVNSLYHYPLYMTFFSTAERLEIGNIPFNCIAPKPGRQEALEYYRNIHRHFRFNIHLYERVGKIIPEAKCHKVTTDKAVYHSKNIIIATGFYDIPVRLNIPGEALPKVSHYFKEAHPYTGQKVVVVGANNSAADAALECWHKGADVTMVIRGSKINERVKYWIKPDIENRIAEGSIKAYFNATLQEIREQSVIIQANKRNIEIGNDFVLALTGYHPDFDLMKNTGIALSDDSLHVPQYNPDTMESNISNIYLAGVVCGGIETHKWFIENSRVHAEIIIRDIMAKQKHH